MVKEQTVDKQAVQATPNLTPAQEALQAVWEEHTQHEFVTHGTEDVLATMVDDAYMNNIPVMIGGVGKAALGEYYTDRSG
jgi:carboxymethylenebutenolidase